jgi:hypothetical protein
MYLSITQHYLTQEVQGLVKYHIGYLVSIGTVPIVPTCQTALLLKSNECLLKGTRVVA